MPTFKKEEINQARKILQLTLGDLICKNLKTEK